MPRVAAVQMASGPNFDANLLEAERLLGAHRDHREPSRKAPAGTREAGSSGCAAGGYVIRIVAPYFLCLPHGRRVGKAPGASARGADA